MLFSGKRSSHRKEYSREIKGAPELTSRMDERLKKLANSCIRNLDRQHWGELRCTIFFYRSLVYMSLVVLWMFSEYISVSKAILIIW